MAINTKQNIFFAVVLTFIVFVIIYFVISKSGESKSNDYEILKSKIVRRPYNVTCRGLFEQNLVN